MICDEHTDNVCTASYVPLAFWGKILVLGLRLRQRHCESFRRHLDDVVMRLGVEILRRSVRDKEQDEARQNTQRASCDEKVT